MPAARTARAALKPVEAWLKRPLSKWLPHGLSKEKLKSFEKELGTNARVVRTDEEGGLFNVK